MTRFGTLVRRIDQRGRGINLPLLSVSQFYGVIRRSEISDGPHRADSLDDYKIARAGDIVFNKMSIRDGAMGLAKEDGLVTYHYEVMRPTFYAEPRYVVYLMKSSWFVGELIKRERGIGAGGAKGVRTTEVPFRVLRTIDCFAPGLERQSAIADFLDRETAQIDAMIEAQQGVVRALRERNEAGWARSYVRLTDNTPVRQVRNCVTSLVDGPFGSALTSSHYTDEGTRVIRLGNIGVNAFKPQDAAFIDDEYAATLAEHAAEAGDVVMAGLGDSNQPLGRACVVPETLGPAIVKADCYRLRPRDGVYARYLAWALSSPPVLAQNSELARGITRQRMNTALAKSVRVAIPPMEAQVAVVERHDSETERLATAIDAALVVTELLHERREALITAAVTGRIDPTTEREAS